MRSPLELDRQRPIFDAIAADKSAPAGLRKALKAGLETYDYLVESDTSALEWARHARRIALDARRSEASRLLERAKERTLEWDNVAVELTRLEAEADSATERSRFLFTARAKAHHEVFEGAFWTHRRETLAWVASVRVDTPWEDPSPDHVAFAWTRISGMFRWEYPTVAHEYKPASLVLDTRYPLSRLVWQAIADERVDYSDRRTRTHGTVLAYWPEYAVPTALPA